jgi:hypothetical protein
MKKTIDAETLLKRAAPLTHQQAHEIQPFGHLVKMPLALSANACKESVDNLNQLLADTITLRDLYKKHHWQIAGPTFYQLHLLFDKHYEEQNALVDAIAERIQLLGGVSIAMAHDVADMTLIPRPPQGARGRAGSDFATAARTRNCVEGGSHDGAARRPRGRRRHQRPNRQRHHPQERTAGVVRGGARRRLAVDQGG